MGSSLPFTPEEVEVMKARADKALVIFIPTSEHRYPDELQTHVFDFKEGYRIVVEVQSIQGYKYWHACFRRFTSPPQQLEGETLHKALESIGLLPPCEDGVCYLIKRDTHFIHKYP
jgi:hypothetical protein